MSCFVAVAKCIFLNKTFTYGQTHNTHLFKINMAQHNYLPLQSRMSFIETNNADRNNIDSVYFKWNLLFSVLKTIILTIRILDEICRNISRPRRVPPSAARGPSRRWTWRHLAEKVGTSKGGGKQWQPTPKNLPRMQCARAIPVAWRGSGSC